MMDNRFPGQASIESLEADIKRLRTFVNDEGYYATVDGDKVETIRQLLRRLADKYKGAWQPETEYYPNDIIGPQDGSYWRSVKTFTSSSTFELDQEEVRWVPTDANIDIVSQMQPGLMPQLSGGDGYIPRIRVLDGVLVLEYEAPPDIFSATPEPTPNQIVQRDASGQARVGAPTMDDHIARLADCAVESWRSDDGQSWYIKFPNKFIIQGGVVARTNVDHLDTLSLMHPFKDTSYRIWFADYQVMDNTDTVYWHRLAIYADTATTFKARRVEGFIRGWVACGWGE